jgi:photosystem II stability/assembly factor-like uncharacterized protein
MIFLTACAQAQPTNSPNSATVPSEPTPTTAKQDSVDGWRIINQVTIPQQTMGAEFLGDQFGVRVGLQGQIDITTDGGQRWTRTADSSVISEAAPDIVDDELIWLSGMGGRVLVSKDSGQNWKFISLTPYTGHIEYLSFVDDQTGWAATTEVSRLFATNDGAQTWYEINLPTGIGEVKAMSLRTPTHGYVLDDTGTLYITANDGQDWSSTSIGLDMSRWTFPKRPASADLLFLDNDHGLLILSLIGDENVVMALRTLDGGQSWQQEILPVGIGQLYLSRDGRTLTVTDLFDNTHLTILRAPELQISSTTPPIATGQHLYTTQCGNQFNNKKC